jgi:hypothetical protein
MMVVVKTGWAAQGFLVIGHHGCRAHGAGHAGNKDNLKDISQKCAHKFKNEITFRPRAGRFWWSIV